MTIRGLLRSRLFIILSITLLYMITYNMTRPIVSLYAVELGASIFMVGLIVSTYALFSVLFSVLCGIWTDRIGYKRMFFIGATGVIIALLVPAALPKIIALFFSQSLIGLAHNCMWISAQKGASFAIENRDKAIVSLTFTASIGEFLGPLIGGFSYEHLGFQTTFYISVIIMLFVCGFNYFLTTDKIQPSVNSDKTKKSSTFSLLKSKSIRKALVASGLTIYSKDLFVAYFPMYGSKIGMSPSQIGMILAMMAGAAILVRAVQYQLVQKFTRTVVLSSSLFLGGIAYILIPFFHAFIILCAISLFLGAGLGLGQPLSIVYILNVSPPGREGELLGLRITVNRLCQLTAPVMFGLLGNSFGVSPIFWTSGTFLLSGSWYSLDRNPTTTTTATNQKDS